MRLAVGLRGFARMLAVLLLPVAITASASDQSGSRQGYRPPQHTTEWPELADGELGRHLERGRSVQWESDQQRKLTAALAALRPQRKGVIDAYVVSAALDSDAVFGREAREAGKVLTRRYDAAGRSIVLAGTDGRAPSALAMGTPRSLARALTRVAEVMDKSEDVLILYLTSHGAQVGIAYHDGDEGFGLITPRRFAAFLDELGIRKRMLILSACYSGIFVSTLSNDDTALLTAAASNRTSFGCRAENDWTFFGDALVNHALRKPQPLDDALTEARVTISDWEMANSLPSSMPQATFGEAVEAWLIPLEARMPKVATAPVGAPATDAFKP